MANCRRIQVSFKKTGGKLWPISVPSSTYLLVSSMSPVIYCFNTCRPLINPKHYIMHFPKTDLCLLNQVASMTCFFWGIPFCESYLKISTLWSLTPPITVTNWDPWTAPTQSLKKRNYMHGKILKFNNNDQNAHEFYRGDLYPSQYYKLNAHFEGHIEERTTTTTVFQLHKKKIHSRGIWALFAAYFHQNFQWKTQ